MGKEMAGKKEVKDRKPNDKIESAKNGEASQSDFRPSFTLLFNSLHFPPTVYELSCSPTKRLTENMIIPIFRLGY